MAHPGNLAKQSWVSAAFVLIFVSLISKLFGFIREVLIARNFGVSGEVDAYLVAVSVPVLVGGVLGSSIGIALIPVYHKVRTADGSQKAVDLLKSAFTVTTLVSLSLMVVLYFVPEHVVSAISPGLPEETAERTVGMLRWLLVLVPAYAVFNILCASYNALHHFKIPAVTDLVSNVVIIASLLILSSSFGVGALVLGLIGGLGAVTVFLAADLMRRGLVGFKLDPKAPEFKELVYFCLPVLAFSLLPQLEVVVENYVASGLEAGSIAALGYGKRLFEIAPTLLAMSVAKAVFPTVSTLSSEGKLDEMRELVAKINRQVVVYFTPLTFLLVLFGSDIVRIAFMRGQFDVAATALTTKAFVLYVPALLFSVLVPIYLRVCYGFSDTKTPLIAAAAAVLILAPLSYGLAHVMGIAGIALAGTLALFVKGSILFATVRKRLGGLGLKRLSVTVSLSFLSATLSMMPFIFVGELNGTSFAQAAILYLLLYAALAWLFMRRELQATLASMQKLIGTER